jgi:hypothetical protein
MKKKSLLGEIYMYGSMEKQSMENEFAFCL